MNIYVVGIIQKFGESQEKKFFARDISHVFSLAKDYWDEIWGDISDIDISLFQTTPGVIDG